MATRLPASQHTREELTALIEGRLSTASAKDELVKLATRLIVEEALEGEAGDALGRDYYEHGAQPGQGYRNGSQSAESLAAAVSCCRPPRDPYPSNCLGSIRLPAECIRQFVEPPFFPVHLDVRKFLSVDPRCALVGFAPLIGVASTSLRYSLSYSR